ncbi:hypothetical protein PHACT_07525 [Pseudohongiella acticola]|uniref:Paraquat-inducible protein A n=1 Tax=Pseudohongiella acticola TaxID=1524254 RepID=A0A1E8CKK3_9GAMM|nr:hypothetical protein PHACT_07525 [Pseudohongiella acticola]
MRYVTKISDRQLWLASAALFLTGAMLPMFTFNKFLIFSDTYSLFSGVLYLLIEGEILLFVAVFSFSIVLPLYKLYLIKCVIDGSLNNSERRMLLIQRLAIVGKWSMADVFVVSIIAATVKLGMFASITVHFGLYVFGIAVLSSMLLAHRLMSGYSLRPNHLDT